MALHEQCVGATDEWYTPKHVFDALGCRFDMDVAAPADRRFISTPTSRFLWADSLSLPWDGFVWMNPPFGKRNGLEPWLAKFFEHGNGIALTPDRTSAPWWQINAARSDAILFVGKKLKFIRADGKPGTSPAQGTTLMAAGRKATEALFNAAHSGLGIFTVPAPLALNPHKSLLDERGANLHPRTRRETNEARYLDGPDPSSSRNHQGADRQAAVTDHLRAQPASPPAQENDRG